jgi:pimeloyl-ACP methyl ester carboxylesterase
MHITSCLIRVSKHMRLAADVGGDPSAPPVILLHGGGQTRHSWGALLRKLVAQGFHVINLDARGHGDSDWAADGNYSFDELAKDLEAIIATLPVPPALVGASMGGSTALQLVGESGSALASALVLVDIVPRIEPKGASRIQAFMNGNPDGFATVADAIDAVAAYNPHRPRPETSAGIMKNLRLRADGRLHWHWDPNFLKRPPRPSGRLSAACAHVRCPTLLIRGMRSDIVSDAGVADFLSLLPSAEVFEVRSAGHMVAGDRNDVFNRAVVDFLHRKVASLPSERLSVQR